MLFEPPSKLSRMSALPWVRAARPLVGLGRQNELPYLEALMEAEEGQPHNDYRLAARIAPPVCAVVCVFTCWLVFRTNLSFGIGSMITLALAAVLWFFLDRARSRKRWRACSISLFRK